MNLSKSAFRRYKVIDNLLRNPMRKYPTMEEIIDACREKLDFEPSTETIQKDIANMKLPHPDGFDAPIKFNRGKGGYEYTDPNFSITGVSLRYEELEVIQEALEMVRAIGGSRISDKFNHAMEKLLSATLESGVREEDRLPVLQTMTPPRSRGFEHFDLFYKACRERIPLSFVHFSYKKRKFGHTLIHPFLIKEFENRWYVIGYSEAHNAIRTFGMDRISEPFMIKKKFQRCSVSEMKAYLNDVYGVFPIRDTVKQKVVIRVSELETHYFLAYPLHESQSIQKDSDGTSTITFELIPSLELARYFLSKGYHVSIMEPQWFKELTQKLAE